MAMLDFGTLLPALNDEVLYGEEAARSLLAAPPGERDALLALHPEWLRVGTFDLLLRHVREEVDRSASNALAITTFVLRHLPRVPRPQIGTVLYDLTRGNALKGHATALFREGERLTEALGVVGEAITIFSTSAAFRRDRADARFVQAQIWDAMGETRVALDILDECEANFADFGDTRRFVRTVMQRGICLFEQALSMPDDAAAEYVQRAYAEFLAALDQAERIGDRRESARLKSNMGHCAVLLQEEAAAREYFAVALREFRSLDMTGEVQRALWGIAELDAAAGKIDDAIALMYDVYDEFLQRGMPADAALVLLDISRKLGSRRPAYAQEACTHLASTMTGPVVPVKVREAAVHLGRQTAAPPERLMTEMGRVYDFLLRYKGDPATDFNAAA